MRLLRPRLTAVLFALALLISAGLPAHAQQDKGPDQLRTLTHEELAIIKVLNAQEKAWNRGDIDSFVTGYKDAPDILFIGTAVSHGFAQMLSDYKHNYPNRESMGTLTYSDLEPKLLDEKLAVLVGRYHLDRNKKAGGPSEGLFSLILEKTEAGWKIIVDHTT